MLPHSRQQAERERQMPKREHDACAHRDNDPEDELGHHGKYESGAGHRSDPSQRRIEPTPREKGRELTRTGLDVCNTLLLEKERKELQQEANAPRSKSLACLLLEPSVGRRRQWRREWRWRR